MSQQRANHEEEGDNTNLAQAKAKAFQHLDMNSAAIFEEHDR